MKNEYERATILGRLEIGNINGLALPIRGIAFVCPFDSSVEHFPFQVSMKKEEHKVVRFYTIPYMVLFSVPHQIFSI